MNAIGPIRLDEGFLLAVASGKGGTGKTTVAVNLALTLAAEGMETQYMDGDVEEPNGHLFLRPGIEQSEPVSIPVPTVDAEGCTACGNCAEACRFNAIAMLKRPLLFPELCHGCGACRWACPEKAITEQPRPVGVVETGRAGPIAFVQGRLNVGEPMAPPVIRAVLKQRHHRGITVTDAPPGASCAVVTTMRDADYVVLVTEPTPFGLNDLRIAVELTRRLDRRFGVVINRSGAGNDGVEPYCAAEAIPVLAKIPNERAVAEAYARGERLAEVFPGFRDRMSGLWSAIRKQCEAPAT